jgi:xylan 1,4-beta-xylosidase
MMRGIWGWCLASAIGVWAAAGTRAEEWTVRFGTTQPPLRPLHGINGGPLCYRGTVDLTSEHHALGIPFTRLHDAPWVNAEAVDIHYLFRQPEADPGDPLNYDFRATDDYLAAVVRSGAGIVYRLGESIEHTARQYWVHPPRNPQAWAAVCLGIVRHYNEGWASGFRYGIRYWEIWNEPDVRPQMWTGTDADYFRLYEVTAKALKARFPEIRVGGPALGNTGELKGETLIPSPFLKAFLVYCRDRQVPLDFLSWHRYTADPEDIQRRAKAVRRCLDEFGFTQTESHLNEWNYLVNDDWTPLTPKGKGTSRQKFFETLGSTEGAAFTISVLLRLQDAPIDVANYYTGEVQGFGLFDFNGSPKATYHAFALFRRFLDTSWRGEPTTVINDRSPDRQAGKGRSAMVLGSGRNEAGTRAAVLLSAPQGIPKGRRLILQDLPWNTATHWEARIVEGVESGVRSANGFLPPDQPLRLPRLSGAAVVLIELQPR